MPDIGPLTIQQAGAALRAGEVTSAELVRTATRLAEALDGEMGTYLARFDEEAMEAAEKFDAELEEGVDRGPLHGIPIGVKDIIASVEGPTTAQSLILDPAWGAAWGDAPVVQRLRAAGAVITGKTTTMEFACGMPDPTKPFPVPRNPWALDRWPGGSSSGTGSGVSAGLFLGGLGTDTGGSIRCPASFCGISGMKQTYGLVPKSGCTALGTSLDHIGPMARSAWDCAAMLDVMAGPHPTDITTVDAGPHDFVGALDGSMAGLRIAVDRVHTLGRDLADPLLVEVFEAAIAVLEGAGAIVTEIELPLFQELTDACMLTWPAEAFSYQRSDLQSRWFDYGDATRAVMVMGAMISAGDYMRAQRVRQAGREQIGALMADFDLIVTPTAVSGAPVIGTGFAGVVDRVLTPVWNAVGFPALSIPMGFDSLGMPLGLQFVGAPFDDATVLRAGDAYQRLTDWHLALPPLLATV
jgi:aspartyl-tRNA(Asn)/glutamyl-tRNA(Gln) amidotransferase subunit A